jgi:predicted amidophosphoribosyltransferase
VGEVWWRVAARDLLGLVLPVGCAGCGADDVAWCADCAGTLDRSPWRAEGRAGRLDRMDGRPPVPVWAVADFAGPVRRAVSAWKDHGRADLTPVFGAAARRATRAAVDEAGELLVRGARATGPGAAPIRHRAGRRTAEPPLRVVPAPSTPAARRTRGWDPAGALAAAVADELGRCGVPARRAPVLRRNPGADQAGLSARARLRNLSGHVRVRRWPGALPGRAVLVDDVLTTGATFAACVRALEAAGIEVVAGIVVASTPSPGTS